MFELTDEQIQSLDAPDGTPPRAVNPKAGKEFVLLRVAECEQIKVEEECDDSERTREELNALGWELAVRNGWDDDYDDSPWTPEELGAAAAEIADATGWIELED